MEGAGPLDINPDECVDLQCLQVIARPGRSSTKPISPRTRYSICGQCRVLHRCIAAASPSRFVGWSYQTGPVGWKRRWSHPATQATFGAPQRPNNGVPREHEAGRRIGKGRVHLDDCVVRFGPNIEPANGDFPEAVTRTERSFWSPSTPR